MGGPSPFGGRLAAIGAKALGLVLAGMSARAGAIIPIQPQTGIAGPRPRRGRKDR